MSQYIKYTSQTGGGGGGGGGTITGTGSPTNIAVFTAPTVIGGTPFGQLDFNGDANNPQLSIGGVTGPAINLLQIGDNVNFKITNNGLGPTTISSDGMDLEFQNIPSIKQNGNLRLTGNLGVGNSVAATLPGTVVKKMEVFDQDGVSLGFIAIYSSIT